MKKAAGYLIGLILLYLVGYMTLESKKEDMFYGCWISDDHEIRFYTSGVFLLSSHGIKRAGEIISYRRIENNTFVLQVRYRNKTREELRVSIHEDQMVLEKGNETIVLKRK